MGKKIGRPAYKVLLVDNDRKFLEGVTRVTTSPQSHVTPLCQDCSWRS